MKNLFFLWLIMAISIVFSYQKINTTRINYSVGDTLTLEDQNRIFNICFSDLDSADTFKFSDKNGNLNGGDYKIFLISCSSYIPKSWNIISCRSSSIGSFIFKPRKFTTSSNLKVVIH